MKQAFHIFRKDVRHYWLEIAASLALMAAFGWFEVRGWWGDEGSTAAGLAFLGAIFGLWARDGAGANRLDLSGDPGRARRIAGRGQAILDHASL